MKNKKIETMLIIIMNKAERMIGLETNTSNELQDKIQEFDYKCKKIFEYIESIESKAKV